MVKYKKVFFYISLVVWFLLIVTIIIYNFFPYQRFIKVAFQGFLCDSRMAVSIDGVKWKFLGATVSKVIFGHEVLQGKPLFEMERLHVSITPFALFRGVIDLKSGGVVKLNIENIPLIRNTVPFLNTEFKNINLSQYPEARLPWFKGITGTMNGFIKKKMPPLQYEKHRGGFSIRLQNGEMREIVVKNGPRISLPYKDIEVLGMIEGNKVKIQNLYINSSGNTIKGTGLIESNDLEQKVDLKLSYEATTKNAPLPGKGTIIITGNQWAADIIITPEKKTEPEVIKSSRTQK